MDISYRLHNVCSHIDSVFRVLCHIWLVEMIRDNTFFVVLMGSNFISEDTNMAGGNHFTSIHAQLGLAVFIGFIALGVFGGVVLHPGNFFHQRTQSDCYYLRPP